MVCNGATNSPVDNGLSGFVRVMEILESLEFYYGIFQAWKVLEKVHWSWKVLEICLTQQKNMKCVKGSKEN